MHLKHLAGLLLPLYCAALLVMAALLSHYPWPHETPATDTEAVITFPLNAPDFKAITDIAQRKQAFFDFLRPMISEQNRLQSQRRQQLLQMQEKIDNGEPLSSSQRQSVKALAERYGIDEGRPPKIIAKLLLHVGTIPESLALAQAASESAWGTSRFARKGHNYFGQWCYKRDCGLVPNRRPEGAKHEVATFTSPYESVKGYFHNINTHRAYRELRQLRQEKTSNGQALTANDLLPALGRYSERGQAYIEDLREIIRFNGLDGNSAE